MATRRSTVALFFVVAAGVAAAAGCADEDPNYGAPESIRGRTIKFPGADPVAEPATDGGVVSTKTAAQLFTDLYNGAGGSPGIKSACAGPGCHSPGGGGVTLFVGTDEASALVIFKAKGYKDIELPNGFYKKGTNATTHAAGAAMQPPLAAIGKAWAAAETAGGGATPVADAAAE